MAKKRTSGAQNRKISKIKITKEEKLKKKIPTLHTYFTSLTDPVSINA